ncbi:MAG: TIGR03790 family protein, partial [Candidatus Thermoplasmatota archaeon]|nr:TIGR03790 family protein [Candidatus Thermoplasmatota archaeon]
DSEISKEIGTYFARMRGLPAENIINISASTSETITPAQFDEIALQIEQNLSERGIESRINYMVTTKGVPLKVSGSSNARASFDSELALVGGDYETSIHGNGWLLNPYYQDAGSFSHSRVGMRLVTRLTGYTVEEAKRLVDLAGSSYGSRGNALMDLDPGKDGSSGYKIGNDWMRGADTWFEQNGYPSLLDENRTFRTGFSDLMSYNSWGSNDGNWSYNHVYNSGFESGTGEQASSWTYDGTGGNVIRNGSVSDTGDWSLKLMRNGSGSLLAYQERDLPFIDHRYILEGRMKLDGVSSQGARIWLEAMDSGDNVVSTLDLRTYSGTRDWTFVQGRMENDTSIVKVRIFVELLGSGVVHFDSMKLRVIRPHNTWVPGALAETCVSTGGRSF